MKKITILFVAFLSVALLFTLNALVCADSEQTNDEQAVTVPNPSDGSACGKVKNVDYDDEDEADEDDSDAE